MTCYKRTIELLVFETEDEDTGPIVAWRTPEGALLIDIDENDPEGYVLTFTVEDARALASLVDPENAPARCEPKVEPMEWEPFEIVDGDGDRLRIRKGSMPYTLFVLPSDSGVYLTPAQALDLGRRLVAWASGR